MTHAQTRVRSYGLIMLMVVTFSPALLKTLVGFGSAQLDGLPGGVATHLYLLAEAVILFSLLVVFTRREGRFSFIRAVPYQKRVPVWLFLILLGGVTAYAIGFRDFIQIPGMMDLVGQIRGLTSGWPPDWIWRPGFGYRYQDVSGTAQIGYMLLGMVSIGSASAMQTLYFRGFVLPRMEYMGWAAPFVNTALFVAFHINSVPFWPMFFVFTLGWGLVTYFTRNVWIAVISHVIFNTYSYVFLFSGALSQP